MHKYIYNYKFYIQVLSLSFLYFISAKMSLLFLHGNSIVNIGLFSAEGVALAFILYFGKRVWLGVFIGQFLLAYSNDINIFTSLVISAINSLEAVLAVIVLDKLKFDIALKRFKDIALLFLVILFLLQPFSALLSNAALLLNNSIEATNFIHSSFSWWFGNVMGQMLIAPPLLLFFVNYKKINLLEYIAYGLVFLIVLYILSIIIAINNPFLLLSLTLPIGLWIVVKKGMVYGTMFSMVMGLVSSYAVYIGIGAFYNGSEMDNVINYNLFVLAHIIILIIIGILFEERKEYENSLEKIIGEEVKKNKEQQLLMLQQSRLAQMGEMISMIAHQWRQPLNNLSLVNQLLISKYTKNKLDENAMEYFKTNSKKQIDLMSSTIDDFRNFFNEEKEQQLFYIADSINSILDMTKVIYTNRGVTIDTDFKDNYNVLGYPNALSQAVLNIINNAKDALVESDVENKEIKIKVYEENEKIVVSIKDNAGGIPIDIIDKIFDPYFSTKKEKNGTGLGLYMSKMIIVEKMDASIEVSNDKYGANFKIYLNKQKVKDVK